MAGIRNVRTPDGVEWRLEREWLRPRVNRPRWPGRREVDVDTFNRIGWVPFDGDVLSWFGVIVGSIATAVIVIPLLLFGIELLVFALLGGSVLLGSVVLARRWMIRATNTDSGRIHEWEIAGRRASAAALNQLEHKIRAGDAPGATEVASSGLAMNTQSSSVPPPHWQAKR
jgi:hypothetical protein